uniref:Putative glycosyltransferase n=1 Tax=viral metagenome TaxID=1070528 RepID=A0A6M3Y4I4_9ZZZZ
MIVGQFFDGSGTGNQLFRYVATRVIAKDKGVDFAMANPEKFKGEGWMKIDKGVEIPHGKELKNFKEREVRTQDGIDIRPYDPDVNFIEDDTLIDGEFQDERYFEHRLDEVREWLKVEPLEVPDDVCVIGFRGGEYKLFPDLYLTKQYWDKAVLAVLLEHPDIKFEVHTDDPEEAKKFFPDYPIIHDVEKNWKAVRFAKHLIIANSSFYILPALLNENVDRVYAPRYWARRNIGLWALPQNWYKKFTYL